MFSTPDQQPRRDAIDRLNTFVKSAATVYSSASTALQEPRQTAQLDIYSQFGDMISWEPSPDLQLWVSSQTELSRNLSSGVTQNNSAGVVVLTPPASKDPTSGQKSAAELLSPVDLLPSSHWKVTPSGEQVGSLETSDHAAPAQRHSSTSNPGPLNDVPEDRPTPEPQGIVTAPAPNKSRRSWFRRSSRQIVVPADFSSSASTLTALSPSSTRMVSKTTSKVSHISHGRPCDSRRKFVFVGDGACGKTCFLM